MLYCTFSIFVASHTKQKNHSLVHSHLQKDTNKSLFLLALVQKQETQFISRTEPSHLEVEAGGFK